VTTINLTITYPTSGASVPGNGTYTSYGSDSVSPSQNLTRKAWVTDSNGTTVANGTVATPPGGSTWAFKFTGLSVGVAYTENVEDTAADGTTNTQSVNFSCSSP
jgi:hypothetical protein